MEYKYKLFFVEKFSVCIFSELQLAIAYNKNIKGDI